MSESTFLPPPFHHDTTISDSYTYPNNLVDNYFNYHQGLELSYYSDLSNEQPLINNVHDDFNSSFVACNISQTPFTFTQEMTTDGSSGSSVERRPINSYMREESRRNGAVKKVKVDEGNAIAIRTKTELEGLDDGFKWRKYGKKMVKNNPNPRNYYKCSTEGCKVKKRIERDGEDSSYLLTTYYGRHNHESPCIIYCDQLPLALSYGLTLKPSESS